MSFLSLSLAGCLDPLPFPTAFYPRPGTPGVTPLADGTKALQCLSQELRPFAADPSQFIRVATGTLLSKTADKVGDISIPRSLKDQASTAIAKVHNAVRYVVANNPYDQPLTTTQGGHVFAPEDYRVPAGVFFIQGGINFAQVAAISKRDIEILGPGLNSKVQKYNVALHFEMVRHPEGTLVGIPVDFTMDFFSIERGASAFVVTSAGLIRGEFLEMRVPSMIDAYQRLTDIGIAALLRQLAVERFNITPTGSQGCVDVMPGMEAVPNLAREVAGGTPVNYIPGHGFCISLPSAGGGFPQEVTLVWLQYIGVGRLIQKNSSAETLGSERTLACFPAQKQHSSTTTMEVKVLDTKGNQVGAGSVVLPLSP